MRFRNQPRSGGRLCFFTSNLPNGNFTVSPRFKASVISSKTAFTTDSASPRLNSLGCHADLSVPRRFGEIAFTRSRRVKMALVGWTTSLATSRLPSPLVVPGAAVVVSVNHRLLRSMPGYVRRKARSKETRWLVAFPCRPESRFSLTTSKVIPEAKIVANIERGTAGLFNIGTGKSRAFRPR